MSPITACCYISLSVCKSSSSVIKTLLVLFPVCYVPLLGIHSRFFNLLDYQPGNWGWLLFDLYESLLGVLYEVKKRTACVDTMSVYLFMT